MAFRIRNRRSAGESPGFGDWRDPLSCERLCLSGARHPSPVWRTRQSLRGHRHLRLCFRRCLPWGCCSCRWACGSENWPTAAAVGALAWPTIDLNVPHTRHTVLFFAASTFVGLVALSFASQRAVEYSESPAILRADVPPGDGSALRGAQERASRSCELRECHVEPGAQGFFKAKLHGTNQLRLAVTKSVSTTTTVAAGCRTAACTSCEQCHFPDRFIGDVVKVVYEFADDEANSKTMLTSSAPCWRAGGRGRSGDRHSLGI